MYIGVVRTVAFSLTTKKTGKSNVCVDYSCVYEVFSAADAGASDRRQRGGPRPSFVLSERLSCLAIVPAHSLPVRVFCA